MIAFPTAALFLLTSIATFWLFLKASRYNTAALLVLLAFAATHSGLALAEFYTNWDARPPRFMFLVGPSLLLVALLFLLPQGRRFLDGLDHGTLVLLHSIRIPVEITLYYVFMAGLIPQSMTFEGSNFDILSGLTAPLAYYLYFVGKKIGKRGLLVWNFACLMLLFNIVGTAILSAKVPFQMFAFEQPNVGIAYFPLVLLPALVVPLVLLSHLASIRKLLQGG